MNSIAIWYEMKAGTDSVVPELDIHINHWKLRPNRSSINSQFMDIGLQIKDGVGTNSICIYVPGEIKDKTKFVEDLGGKLKDVRILTAVFNDSYSPTTRNDSKDFIVQDGEKALFKVYSLDVANDIEIEPRFGGTILRFPFRYTDGLPTYYRLRIKSSFVNNLSFTYRPSNALFESVNSSIEIIDFRINDARNLNLSLIEYMRGVGKFNIALVHYFVMRSVRDEYIVSNEDLKSVRQLEEQTWTNYITQSEYDYEKTFAYHIKQKAAVDSTGQRQFINDFSALLKFRFEDSRILPLHLLLNLLRTGYTTC